MYSFEKNSFVNCEQKFYIMDQETFTNLKQLRQLDEVCINHLLIERVDILLQFSNDHDGFCCAITKAKGGRKYYFWLPILFYKQRSNWVRVRIEITKCSICGWQGSIANPTLPDLYETLDNRFELIKAAAQIDTIPCPKCHGILGRHAIWAESDDKDLWGK